MDETDDTPANPLLARADAFMQRRRPAAAPEYEDLPVLTEVVGCDEGAPPLAAETRLAREAPMPVLDPDLVEALAHELTRRVHERLAAEIPSLVEAALQSVLGDLTQILQEGIEETSEGAIRDFLGDHDRLARLRRGP